MMYYIVLPSTKLLPFTVQLVCVAVVIILQSCTADTNETELELEQSPPPPPDTYLEQEQEQQSVQDEPEEHTNNNGRVVRIRPPYLNSPVDLTQLAQTEQFVYEALRNYENELLERLQILQRYRTDYEESVVQALSQNGVHAPDRWSEAYVVSSNPLLTYRMIRRFTKDLPAFTEHVWKSLENELWETLETLKGHTEWPSQDDFLSASKSLIRLQDTHDFHLEYFTDGVIRDHPVKAGITAQQSLEVSQTALALGDVTAATEWFQVAHSKAIHGQYTATNQNFVPMNEITDSWERTYKAFQEIWPMTVFKTHDVFVEAKTLLRQDFDRSKFDISFDNRNVNFKALCRGDKLKSDAELAKLNCFNDRTFHPYLYLNPLKVEIHNWEPLIYQIHDFLGVQALHDMGISAVASLASFVESGLAFAQTHDDFSTFSSSWLDEVTAPQFRKLSGKLARLVGLVGKTGEDSYQISAYAVGNHHEPCVSCYDFEHGSENNSIRTRATVHAVLHEPELGGELAFTLTGTLVKPLRGSLIIHYNLHPTTKEPDERILHGSCPVLIGQKWLATKLMVEL